MKKVGRPPEPIVHGTVGGYFKEWRRTGTTCPECRDAWRKHQRQNHARRKYERLNKKGWTNLSGKERAWMEYYADITGNLPEIPE